MRNKEASNNLKDHSTPFDPLLRLPVILKIFPIGRSTWWLWVATGKAPNGIKLGKKTTAWRSSDIQQLLADFSSSGRLASQHVCIATLPLPDAGIGQKMADKGQSEGMLAVQR